MPRLSNDQHALLTATVDRWLRKNYHQPVDLPALEREVGITRFLLCRLYHERSGKTIRLKQREIRINRAAKLLSGGTRKISEVALAVGYGSQSHFTKAFLAERGMLPSAWKSRPKVIGLPKSAGDLPLPGLTGVKALTEVPPDLSHVSGHWNPAGIAPATPHPATRRPRRTSGCWKHANAFLD